jgi:phage gp16-like protein
MEPKVVSVTRMDREPRVVAVNRAEKEPVVTEVITHALPPAPEPIQVQAPPAKKATNKSVIRIDDEERYRTVANEMHGYGRNNIKSRVGNSNMTYSKRNDLRNKDYIVSGKDNNDKYRNDPACTLI